MDYAAAAGTALPGEDYDHVSGTLSFAPGVTARAFAVPIRDDAVPEGSETLTVTLANPANAAMGRGAAVVTIHDDDAPVWRIYLPWMVKQGGARWQNGSRSCSWCTW